MDALHKISQATGAWLQYEFALGKSNLFNERYLSNPLGAVLGHLYPHQVHAEYLHPILAPTRVGLPGRRPEVDFAVVQDRPNLICAVESKWVGKNGLSADAIIWDLLRLELIAHNSSAKAYFVLAGRKKHLDAFFQSSAFLGKQTPDGRFRRLLKLDQRRNARLRIDSPPLDRLSVYQRIFAAFPTLSFSSRITTSTPATYPVQCQAYQYQAYAWEVLAPANTTRFIPGNNKLYRGEK